MPNSKSLLSKTMWSSLASICNLLGRLFTQVMIARTIGPDGIGRVAYVIWLIEIANVLCSFGLLSSLTRYLAELHGQNKSLQASFFTQWVFKRYLILLIVGAAVVGVMFFCSSQYKGAESVLPALTILFLANGLQAIYQAELAGRQRFDLLARINLVTTIALIVCVTIGGYFYGVIGIIYAYVAAAFIPAACSFTILRGVSNIQEIDFNLRRRVWRFSFYTWLSMLVSAFVWSRTELFFLERYWGIKEISMFTVGLTFTVMVQQLATLFSGAFMAHFSGLIGDGNHELVHRHYETITRLVAFIVIPLAFGTAAIMPALLPLLFGQEFIPAIPNAMVLTATAALAFSTIGSSLVYAKERSGFIALSGLVGAILSVVAGFVIISNYGVWGAVWSRMFVQSFMVALGMWFIAQRLHFSYPYKSLWNTFVAASLCAFSAWLTIQMMPNHYFALGLAIPLGVAVYIIGVKFFRILGQEEVCQLRRFANRLPAIAQKLLHLTLDAVSCTK